MIADEIRHVAEFTKDEMKAEIYKEAWIVRRNVAKAWEAWGVFTLLEHYRVKLPANHQDRTAEQVRTLQKYEEMAAREQAEFDATVNVKVEVDEAFAYIDKLTDEVLRNVE